MIGDPIPNPNPNPNPNPDPNPNPNPNPNQVILGVRDAAHLEEHAALRDVAIDAEDAAQIEAVLAKGEPPRGDIWSFERGLDS